MSYYTKLELSQNQFDNIMTELEFATEIKTDYHEIADLVHLIDLLYDKYDEDNGRQNREIQDSIRYHQFKESGEYMQSDLFWSIHDILKEMDADSEDSSFYTTCKLIDLFDGKKK